MQLREAEIAELVESGDLDRGEEPLTTQRMGEVYPLFSTSLLSLIKNAEGSVQNTLHTEK